MKLSVIIPAYNEEDEIADTIQAVRQHGGRDVVEIIAVDGDSTDATLIKAQEAGARAIISPKKGRAAQMNYGAHQAKGEILYFLHADSRPPAGFAEKVKQAVSDGFESGCFQLAFDQEHPLLNFYAWCTAFDIDAFRFGDQSLFIMKDAFSSIGGFREDHIVMEDNEIVRRIKREYSFAILNDAVETSARSYQQVGVVKLQLIFVLIYLLYFFGVEQEKLAHIRQKSIS